MTANLFRLDASIRVHGSVSREVADTVEHAWRAGHPDGTVTRRDVGTRPPRPESWLAAASGRHIPADQRSAEQLEGATVAAELAGELIAADAYLFAVPLYNFGVPQHVKTWVDLLFADPRLAAGGDRPLAGRPAVLVVSRGGGYGPGTPREGWDHSTPWLRRIFADVYGLDLRVVEAELTLADVNPALAGLRDVAARSRADAHTAAAGYGRELTVPRVAA
jgi:FMN-dependent NADH-azoreductase